MPRQRRVVTHHDAEEDSAPEEESSSSDEELGNDPEERGEGDSGGEDEGAGGDEAAALGGGNVAAGPGGAYGGGAAAGAAGQRAKLQISLSSKNDVCKVCGKRGHRAGFVGSVYLDCPNKPCYLCKQMGHTTNTCPYRILPGHGCTAAGAAAVAGGGAGRGAGRGVVAALHARECSGSRHAVAPRRPPVPRYQVEAAILKLHTRRCCALEFHPTKDSLVVSGDKKGAVAVWDYDQVHERTVYDTVHSCLTNAVRFLPWLDAMTVATASSDGTSKLLDLETGSWRPLLDLNPGGWVQGGPWHMVYGCDASPNLSTVVVGDSNGCVHLLDPRTRGSVSSLQLHKKGNKVVSVHMHPLHPSLVLTAGNDHSARIFDIRELSSAPRPPPPLPYAHPSTPSAAAAASPASGSLSPSSLPSAGGAGGGRGAGGREYVTTPGGAASGAHAELAVMKHPRVVNAAYWSPHTGRRILTTCQDNRCRVWDYAPWGCNAAADREIVHSHDFNRYLTPFKAEWDPKDPTESLFVVGRYISEDFGGTALHPVDVINAADGALAAQLVDANLTTISPVNKPHPRRELIVTGSSRSLYLWAPLLDTEEQQQEDEGVPAGRPAAAAAGAGGSSAAASGESWGAGGLPRTARNFTSFDADPGAGGKKRKAEGKGKGKGGQVDEEDED